MCFRHPLGGAVGSKETDERKVMSVRSGTVASRVVSCVPCFGRSLVGAVMSFPDTLPSVSPLTVGSFEQIELGDRETAVR